MTDKELLEAAARAAGYEWNPDNWINVERLELGIDSINMPTISSAWNPLENNDHAFRLMVDLELAVISSKPQTWCESKRGIEAVNHCNDKMSATRRAIVLAAAGLVKK